jgi:hypothetical protein
VSTRNPADFWGYHGIYHEKFRGVNGPSLQKKHSNFIFTSPNKKSKNCPAAKSGPEMYFTRKKKLKSGIWSRFNIYHQAFVPRAIFHR